MRNRKCVDRGRALSAPGGPEWPGEGAAYIQTELPFYAHADFAGPVSSLLRCRDRSRRCTARGGLRGDEQNGGVRERD
jgi:hypothetical protein